MLRKIVSTVRGSSLRIQHRLSKSIPDLVTDNILSNGAVFGSACGFGLGFSASITTPFSTPKEIATTTVMGTLAGCAVGFTSAIPVACLVKAPIATLVGGSLAGLGLYGNRKLKTDKSLQMDEKLRSDVNHKICSQ